MIDILTRDEIKSLFSNVLLNNTDKVTKISDHSVLSGVITGASRLFSVAMKELSIVDMYLDIDSAFNEYLDNIAKQWGVGERLGSVGSSTYLRIIATPGTVYLKDTHKFTGNHNLIFELESNLTVGDLGFNYAKVRCTTIGKKTNVNPLSINRITNNLTGHISVYNEYKAEYGRDVEDDELFRIRIKNAINIASKNTLEQLNQIFQKINPNVLKVYSFGFNEKGQLKIGVLTQDGGSLIQDELDDLEERSAEYLALSDLSVYGRRYLGIKLQNVEYQPIDLSFRIELLESYDIDSWRIECQTKLSKFLDYRYWPDYRITVDRGDLLAIAKSTAGVKYIPDSYFYPQIDTTIENFKFPRVRSFILYDLQGNILTSNENILSPIYYPHKQDINYQQIFLSEI